MIFMQHSTELRWLASTLYFRFTGSRDAPQFPMNQKNPHLLFLLPKMTVQKQGFLVTVTFPEILAFNKLSVCISGSFLPKGFPRAARFHSCLLQSQAVRGNQPAQRFTLRQGACEKPALGFLGALLSGKNIGGFDT